MGLFNFLFGGDKTPEKQENSQSLKTPPNESVLQSNVSQERLAMNDMVFMSPPVLGSQLPANAIAAKTQAVDLKRLGEFNRASQIYKNVMNAFPDDADTYKGMAKLEIAKRVYHEAVYGLTMWIELTAYYLKTQSTIDQYREAANHNLKCLESIGTFRVKSYDVSMANIYSRIAESDGMKDAMLMASINKDPYLMLGFCYVMLFPADVAELRFPRELLINYGNVLSGRQTGCDFRGSKYEAYIFVIGLLMAMANVRGNIRDLEKKALRIRWNRRPTYAILTQIFGDAKSKRDAIMRSVLESVVSSVNRRFGCSAKAVHAIDFETMFNDQQTHGNELMALVNVTRSPLVTINPEGLSYVGYTNRIVDELRYTGDVYGLRIEIPVDDDDHIISNVGVGSVDEEVAGWISQRYNRNVHCGGTRRADGVSYRQFCWCEIIQV